MKLIPRFHEVWNLSCYFIYLLLYVNILFIYFMCEFIIYLLSYVNILFIYFICDYIIYLLLICEYFIYLLYM